MEDEQVTEQAPVLVWEQRHQVLFHLRWIIMPRQAHAACEATHMRVHHHALVHAEGVAEHHVGRLARHAAQREQRFHRAWHLAAEALVHGAHALVHRARLVAPEVQRAKERRDRVRRGGRVVRRGGKGREQRGRGSVHADVGALRAEDGGHQQFVRFRPVQLAVRIGVVALQRGQQAARATQLFGCLALWCWARHGAMVGNRARAILAACTWLRCRSA